MFKEFRCTENTDKALSLQNFSPDRPKITKLLMVDLSFKTIIFKEQMEFQNFKIIQDFKKVHMRRFFFDISWSSDFTLYLEDCLMYEHHTSRL